MKKEKLSIEIIIPIYNEEKELEESVTKMHSFLEKNLHKFFWHITIADNASTDKSLEIAKKLSQKHKKVSYIHLDQKGRGRAVKKAWKQSKADLLAYTDVDLSTDLGSLKPMLASLENNYDIAIASRLLSDSVVSNRSVLREVISRMYNVLLKIAFQVKFSDAQCGFKSITKKAFTKMLPYIENNEWFFDTELLVIGQKSGLKIYEHPVSWRDNPGSTVRVLPTIMEDLSGVWRLFITKPWRKIIA